MTAQCRLKVEDLKAWIEIDGRPLPCYDVDNLEDGQASCWIASEEDKCFTVNIRQGKTKYWTQVTLNFDGHKFQPDTEFTPGMRVYSFSSVASLRKGNAEMPFKFASCSPPECGTEAQRGFRVARRRGPKVHTMQRPGMIVVEVRRETSSLPLIPPDVDETQHRIVYGEPREGSAKPSGCKRFSGRLEGSRNIRVELIAVFTFQYCPLETLYERGVLRYIVDSSELIDAPSASDMIRADLRKELYSAPLKRYYEYYLDHSETPDPSRSSRSRGTEESSSMGSRLDDSDVDINLLTAAYSDEEPEDGNNRPLKRFRRTS